MTTALRDKSCTSKQTTALAQRKAETYAQELHTDWVISNNQLSRRFTFKAYAKAVYHANLAAFVGDQQGHHPDVSFGWGYCTIVFTTHDAGGLTENDFICAAKIDQLTK